MFDADGKAVYSKEGKVQDGRPHRRDRQAVNGPHIGKIPSRNGHFPDVQPRGRRVSWNFDPTSSLPDALIHRDGFEADVKGGSLMMERYSENVEEVSGLDSSEFDQADVSLRPAQSSMPSRGSLRRSLELYRAEMSNDDGRGSFGMYKCPIF